MEAHQDLVNTLTSQLVLLERQLFLSVFFTCPASVAPFLRITLFYLLFFTPFCLFFFFLSCSKPFKTVSVSTTFTEYRVLETISFALEWNFWPHKNETGQNKCILPQQKPRGITDCFQSFACFITEKKSLLEIPFLIRIIVAYFQICIQLGFICHTFRSIFANRYLVLRQTDVLLRLGVTACPLQSNKCEKQLK